MIDRIAASDVPAVWEHASAALEAPLSVLRERTPHDLLVELVTGQSTLWHTHTEGASAWATTAIEAHPQKRVAKITLCAGILHPDSYGDMRNAFCRWAADAGCKELRIRGRRGWGKWLPDAAITYLFRLELT